MSEEKKLRREIRNGLVAVLYSPGYGAGWSTWNYDYPELIYDPSIVYMVEEMNKLDHDDLSGRNSWVDNIVEYCKKTYPSAYCGGADDLRIEWMPEGTLFKINEYDGSESIEYKENDTWRVA